MSHTKPQTNRSAVKMISLGSVRSTRVNITIPVRKITTTVYARMSESMVKCIELYPLLSNCRGPASFDNIPNRVSGAF